MRLILICTEINGMLLTTGDVLFRIIFSDKDVSNHKLEYHTLDPGEYEIGKKYTIVVSEEN